ncbi:Ca-activated chloride channel family protein [Noviherbaspirillum humi]|uniref:Ca-activated chloride channel family protein n=1 Tax=Noviherbaspirillum humi TaxID=1688639 RepID=A0A239C3I2_9BURK|nr:VWA domain-containing protein [Noviherbaspirillum humi]SNS14218.1 Ca-activated chloride channel family protein [Noviherbaspirillum humi]
MKFLWPEMFWLLPLLPGLIWLYLWMLKRRKKLAVRYASLGLVKQAMNGQSRWKRHVPPALLLFGITAMLLAASRPTAVITLPSQQQTIMLAMDVSGSMRATDVQPNRLVAAQNAAKAFIEELPSKVKVGIVAFAGTAAVVQPPTLSHDDLYAAIDRFQLQRGTAIGSGLVLSLATLFPEAGIDLSDMTYERPDARAQPLGARGRNKDPKNDFRPVPPGSNNSFAIILLTDGQQTTGIDTMEAARMAAERGVRVYTVGIGTVEGETIGFEGWSMRVRLDEDTLKQVSGATQGTYFYAGTAEELKKVYQTLSSRLVMEKRETEISGLFALVGALFAIAAAGLSLLWFNRVV